MPDPAPPVSPERPSSRPPTTPERHLDAIAAAARSLQQDAAAAGLRTRVPTCPRWTVADLVAHQGMVHRWAAANLRHDDARIPSKTEILRTVPRDRLLAWFADGAATLLATLVATPPDAQALVFLNDAPTPRAFWARRQAHETTIHAVDALAARLGRTPTALEVGLDPDIALDGTDELLRGFFTRGRSRLAGGEPFTVAVRPDDAVTGWLLQIGPERLTTERLATDGRTAERRTGKPRTADPHPATDVVFAGTIAQLYLGLWNRGDEIRATGRTEVLNRWREVQRVSW